MIYGSIPPRSVYSPLPPWAAWYSLLVFPIVWGLTEQSLYNGFCLPRFAETLGPGRAAVTVCLVWGAQHIALPLTFDPRFMLFRSLSFLPLAAAMTMVYLGARRLVPLIVAHWLVDMFGILTGIVLPMLTR